MQKSFVAIPVWCLVAVMALLTAALWTVYTLMGYRDGSLAGGWNWAKVDRSWTGYAYDGSLIEYTPGWGNQVRIVEPPTVMGFMVAWWPTFTSSSIGLLTLAIALLPNSGRLLRKRTRIPRPRLTLFRVMVVIGTVSAWLWLARFDIHKRIVGTIIFAFMLHAGFRRSFLAKKTNTEAVAGTVLSRAGIAGYSLVLLLAFAWVICILVWDSYQEHRF